MDRHFDARWPLLRVTQPVTTRLPEAARVEGFACRIVTRGLLASGRGRSARGSVNGAEYDLSLSDYVETKAWITGRQEPDVLRFCEDNFPPGGLAVDVGANVGFLTVPLGKHAREVGGTVIAIEALPRNVERLTRHVSRAGVDQSVEVIGCAAGDRPGEVEITVESEAGFTSNGIARKQGEAPLPGRTESFRVPVDTLDAICEARGIDVIDVVKLDVEGFEPLVLQGAGGLLARGGIRCGVLEINETLLALRGWTRASLIDLLRANGLRPEPLSPTGDLETDFDVTFRATRDLVPARSE